MKTKSVLVIAAVAMLALAIGQVQGATITVPNHSFELIYKPGSTTITADLDGGWTNGVGPYSKMNGDQIALYSDDTSGDRVDIPGWINAPSWPINYTWDKGAGSVTNQRSDAPDGDYYYTANGFNWGVPDSGAIESDALLGYVNDGTYTVSMLVNGPLVPVVLDLLASDIGVGDANEVVVPPSSTVDPGTYEWSEFSRTYDAADLPGFFGRPLRIRVGWGPDIPDGGMSQSHLDDVKVDIILPLSASPEYGEVVGYAEPIELFWTLPDPAEEGGVVSCDVYFGTDPNTGPGDPNVILMDNNPKVVSGDTNKNGYYLVGSNDSIVILPNAQYFWQVVVYDSSVSTTKHVLRPYFTFTASNVPPVAEAGEDVVTWLTDGTVDDILLSGTATDEDNSPTSPPAVGWEITDAPEGSTATIDPPSADQLDIAVTGITVVGTYEVTLTADDGQDIDDDTVQIRVYTDPCTASQAEVEQPLGDVTGPLGVPDCIVDLYDLVAVAGGWLYDSTLQ